MGLGAVTSVHANGLGNVYGMLSLLRLSTRCVQSRRWDLGDAWPPWGKVRRGESGLVESVHPLLDHMVDVAARLGALASCHAIERALNRAASRALTSADHAPLKALALLHDIRKANAGLQARWKFESDKPCGHGPEAWALLAGAVRDAGRILQGLPRAMESWGDAVLPLLRAGISHHGRPVSEQGAHDAHVWRPVKDGVVCVFLHCQRLVRGIGNPLCPPPCN